jgi:hypothetical protein
MEEHIYFNSVHMQHCNTENVHKRKKIDTNNYNKIGLMLSFLWLKKYIFINQSKKYHCDFKLAALKAKNNCSQFPKRTVPLASQEHKPL